MDFCLDLITAHYRLTSVSMVGLQVWRGSLLLSDFILNSKESDPSPFRDKVILELAAGTGLTSVVAATVAKSVICTGWEMKLVN